VAATGQGAAAFVFDADGRLLLLRQGYEGRRWGPPGGRLEPGEDPLDCVVREAREEAGIDVAVEHLIGLYRLENGFAAYAFRCRIAAGEPAIQDVAEIIALGWFAPDAVRKPRTNLLHHALADAVAGEKGVVRDRLPRLA
jgi:8-oxo-dGTP pyrophosphatase MutT (NUDIX family)